MKRSDQLVILNPSLQEHRAYLSSPSLVLWEINFPNGAVRANWYAGRCSLAKLIFQSVSIRWIEPNAFASEAFYNLGSFQIFDNTIHVQEYNPEILKAFRILSEFVIFEYSNPNGFPRNFLSPVRRSLDRFFYRGLILNHEKLSNLFGGERLRLTFVSIDCGETEGNTDFIAAENFTGLIYVRVFHLFGCGLQFIRPGTFDVMTDTLMTLGFCRNHLLKIDFNVFRKFLDVIPETWSLQNRKFIIITSTKFPLECSDEFYKLRNMTFINLALLMEEYMICVDNQSIVANGQHKQQQILHGDRWNVKSSHIIAFPKFTIRFNETTRDLIVAQMNAEPFRLFIWEIGFDGFLSLVKPYCPNRDTIHGSVDCRRLQNRTEVVKMLSPTGQSELMAACVIMVPSGWKKSVPLHCAIIRMPLEKKYDVFSSEQLLVFFGVCGLHSAIVFLLTWIIAKKIWRKKSGDKSSNENPAENQPEM